jgi:ABC-type transporter lipoprotein component MlaA
VGVKNCSYFVQPVITSKTVRAAVQCLDHNKFELLPTISVRTLRCDKHL